MKRNVISVTTGTTLGAAVKVLVEKHVGTLPVVNEEGKLVGLLGMAEILELFLPNFVNLIANVDFVRDFGAAEELHIDPAVRVRPVADMMREPVSVQETAGLIRAYTKMLQHDLHDLPVVMEDGTLIGIASRVDIGVGFLSHWGTGPLDSSGAS